MDTPAYRLSRDWHPHALVHTLEQDVTFLYAVPIQLWEQLQRVCATWHNNDSDIRAFSGPLRTFWCDLAAHITLTHTRDRLLRVHALHHYMCTTGYRHLHELMKTVARVYDTRQISPDDIEAYYDTVLQPMKQQTSIFGTGPDSFHAFLFAHAHDYGGSLAYWILTAATQFISCNSFAELLQHGYIDVPFYRFQDHSIDMDTDTFQAMAFSTQEKQVPPMHDDHDFRLTSDELAQLLEPLASNYQSGSASSTPTSSRTASPEP
jgi:hypothetical protein